MPARGLMLDVYRLMRASCVCCRGDGQRRKRVATDVSSLPFLRISPSSVITRLVVCFFFLVTHLPKTLTRLHGTAPTTCFSF